MTQNPQGTNTMAGPVTLTKDSFKGWRPRVANCVDQKYTWKNCSDAKAVSKSDYFDNSNAQGEGCNGCNGLRKEKTIQSDPPPNAHEEDGQMCTCRRQKNSSNAARKNCEQFLGRDLDCFPPHVLRYSNSTPLSTTLPIKLQTT